VAKNNFGSVFSFAKICGFWFGFGLTKLTGFVFFFDFLFFLHCMLFNVYTLFWVLSKLLFTELLQLIVTRSDSELEVQRCCMKKNILTVDPIMLEDELWMRQCEKLSPNCQSRFLKAKLQKEHFSLWFWGWFPFQNTDIRQSWNVNKLIKVRNST